MKTCPRCNATLFEDMTTCFGCMFRFEGELDLDEDFLDVVDDAFGCCAGDAPEAPSLAALPAMSASSVAVSPGPHLDLSAIPASVSETVQSHGGDWLVRLELKNIENPQQIWSMELTPACWGSLVVA